MIGGKHINLNKTVKFNKAPWRNFEDFWFLFSTAYNTKSSINSWWLTPIPGCLSSGLSWFDWCVSFAPEFQCCYFCESSCLFYLSFNFDFYVQRARNLPRKPNNYVSEEPRQNKGRGLVDRKLIEAPSPAPTPSHTCPKAALLFSDFRCGRCGMWLFIALLVRYTYRK